MGALDDPDEEGGGVGGPLGDLERWDDMVGSLELKVCNKTTKNQIWRWENPDYQKSQQKSLLSLILTIFGG